MAEPFPVAFATYCQAVYELGEDDIATIKARLADRLQVSRPAVSEMIRRLEHGGLVSVHDGRVVLSAAGTALAEQLVRRHRIAERFLTDVLRISWADAHTEAERWAIAMSDTVELAMLERLGHPTTCPHGNPIPGSPYDPPGHRPLAMLVPGEHFEVLRVPEALEFTPGMLDFLERCQLTPGQQGLVIGHSPDGTVTVRIGEHAVGLGPEAAARLQVIARRIV